MLEDTDEGAVFSCGCGIRYRADPVKAGRTFACKVCGQRVRFPGQRMLSISSRTRVLVGCGIDPVAAEAAYRTELEPPPLRRQYRCAQCSATLPPGDEVGAYVRGALLCSECRSRPAATPERTQETAASESVKFDRSWHGLSRIGLRWMSTALGSAAGHGALFFVGFAGPFYILAGLNALTAILLSIPVALVGARLVYDRHDEHASAATTAT